MTEPDRTRDRKNIQVILVAIAVGLLVLYGAANGLVDSFRVIAESSETQVHDPLPQDR